MVEKEIEKILSCLGGDAGGDGEGLDDKLLLLLLLLLILLLSSSLFELKDIRFSFDVFNLLCTSISIVFGAFLSVYLQHLFYQLSSSRNNKPIIGLCASKGGMSLTTSSCGFCLRKMFLATGSNFCLKLIYNVIVCHLAYFW